MTAPHDNREAVEAMAAWHHQQAADYGWHHAKHSLRDQHAATGEMLARLLDRAEAAEAMCAGYRTNESDLLAERDALAFERNNLKAALATARADALREAAKLAVKQRLTKLDDQNLEHVGHFRACMALELAILALIPPQEAQHD